VRRAKIDMKRMDENGQNQPIEGTEEMVDNEDMTD
jgi:hypothetical protein